MDFDEISITAKQLGYRDKLRLAQLLIQLARREEEQEHSKTSVADCMVEDGAGSELQLIAKRIRKLRPRTRKALINSIDAMYQFRGGISTEEKDRVVGELSADYGIAIDQSGRVSYSN